MSHTNHIKHRVLMRITIATIFALGLIAALSTFAAGNTLYVATDGNDASTCSQSSPCLTINAAYQKANPGDTIELAGGTYPNQSIEYRPDAENWPTSGSVEAGFSSNVTVRPTSGATVTVSGIRVDSPHVTIKDMTSTAEVFLWLRAKYGRAEKLTSRYVSLNADNTALVKSRVFSPRGTGPDASYDAVRLSGEGPGQPLPSGILLEDNDLGPALKSDKDICWKTTDRSNCPYGESDEHLDSVQGLGAKNLIIRRNLIREADSQSMALGDEFGTNENVLVENNVIEGCSPPRAECEGYFAMGAKGINFKVLNNTIKGSIYPENGPLETQGYFVGNIVSRLQCYAGYPRRTQNLVTSPAATDDLGGCPNNTLGTPTYAEDGRHLAAGSLGINFGVLNGSGTDMDCGSRTDGSVDVGADEFGAGAGCGTTGPQPTPSPPSSSATPASSPVASGNPSPSADVTKPTAAITSPAAGSRPAGAVPYTATAEDNIGVTKVEFYIAGQLKNTDTSAPYGYTWDTTTYAHGGYDLQTKAYDAAGNVGESAVVNVVVDNNVTPSPTPTPTPTPTPNVTTNEAPVINMTKPLEGGAFNRKLSMAATASDDKGVTKVEFYLDNKLLHTDTTAGYSYAYKVPDSVANGPHTAKAVAYDSQGLTATDAATVYRTGSSLTLAASAIRERPIISLAVFAALISLFGFSAWRMGRQ